MGVGLSISKRIIEAHGGDDVGRAKSRRRHRVSLHLAAGRRGGPCRCRIARSSISSTTTRRPAIARLPVELGGPCRASLRLGDGVSRRTARNKGGCLITDMRMPGMTGLELLHELRGQGVRPPGHRRHRPWRRAAGGRGDEGGRHRLHREAVRPGGDPAARSKPRWNAAAAGDSGEVRPSRRGSPPCPSASGRCSMG